jgi:dUTP pyrophosphatase
MTIFFSKVREVETPTIGTVGSAGIDFYIPKEFSSDFLTILGNSSILIPSGIKVNLPSNTCLILHNKSGISTRDNLIVGACVIDEDYQGEMHFHLFNMTKGEVRLKPGQKIVQGILLPNYCKDLVQLPIEDLYSVTSERGDGGFGSTGV